MHDKGVILGGLAVFVGLLTFPFWYNLATGGTARAPDLPLPANEKACVAPLSYMRTSHMTLLVGWREDVVRGNVRTYTAADGKTYTMSLTGTCLKQCHSKKSEFCDRCHNYSGVRTPYCWDCHVDPETLPTVARPGEPQPAAGGDGHE